MSLFDPHFNSLFDFVNEHNPELLAKWWKMVEEQEEAEE